MIFVWVSIDGRWWESDHTNDAVFHSLLVEIAIVAYEPDDMVKEKKMVTLNNEVIPFYLTKLNVIAKENNGHLVLGKPTWADVYFAGILDYLNYLTKTNLLENFPNLQEVVQKVLDNENVKAYIAKRPITEV